MARQARKTGPSREIDLDFFSLLSGFGVRRDGRNLKRNWYFCFWVSEKRLSERRHNGRYGKLSITAKSGHEPQMYSVSFPALMINYFTIKTGQSHLNHLILGLMYIGK